MDTTLSTTADYSVSELPAQTQQVRVGVIGCGYWGPKLIRNLHDMTKSELALVADLRQERLDEVKDLYPDVETTCDHRDLLNGQVDAIVIATPVRTHYRLAREALLAGKHVLVEKPITANAIQAQELIEIAESKGLTLMVGHTFRYNPAVEAVREVLQSGELGNVYYIDAVRVNLGLFQPDINVMWDLAPHDISMLNYILEKKPVAVSARGAAYVNHYLDLDEVVYLNIKFEGGAMANIRLSWLDPVKQRRLTLIGSQKMLVYDDLAPHDRKVVIYDKRVDIAPFSVTEEEFRASYRHGEEHHYPLEWREPLNVECNHFVDCIRTGATPRSDGQEGLQVLRILETAERSLHNGGVELLVEY